RSLAGLSGKRPRSLARPKHLPALKLTSFIHFVCARVTRRCAPSHVWQGLIMRQWIIDRRQLANLIAAIAMLLAGTHSLAAATIFLVFIADEQGFGDLSCYGQPTLQKP